MPGDEYRSHGGGGALKLKGGKVKKAKKKKDKSSLETALSAGEASSGKQDDRDPDDTTGTLVKPKRRGIDAEPEEEDPEEKPSSGQSFKTESERRFAEAKRKKLLEMMESANARPELLKTHKQRVEELNTYLSKLSEHHDMPKIGPG